MPYQIEYSESPFGVVTRFSGVLTDEELQQSCLDRIASEDRFRKLEYVLDDFTDVAELKVSSEAVMDAAAFAVKVSELNSEIKYLSVMPSDVLFGLSRMWHACTDETNWERGIVRTREEAEQWLKENIYRG